MEQQLLPPGFRFYPTEEELITFYLHHKLHTLAPELDLVIPSIEIYSFEPSQLPGLAGELCNGDREQWFFFSPRQEREARGGRPNRTTASGYWKATGSPTCVYSSENKAIGMKKTMVFYKGRAPTGRKTKWKMNEYKAFKLHSNPLIQPSNTSYNSTIPELRHELSLCRVYIVSGCARAFDRRPPGRLLVPNTNRTTAQNSIANGTKNDQTQGSLTAVAATFLGKKSCSSSDDSSNSGGLHPEQEAAKCGTAMADDAVENYLDLEQLNWL